MAKICTRNGGNALYMDCLECDNKICHDKKQNAIWAYMDVTKHELELCQNIFVVFIAKRLGYKKDLVFKGRVVGILLTNYWERECIQYKIQLLKCVNEKDFDMDTIVENIYTLDIWVDPLKTPKEHKPVFTSKEKCKRWLKEW